MISCPRCGSEAQPTGKKWKYGVFDVEGYNCNECNEKFHTYYRYGKIQFFDIPIPKSSKS